MRVSRLSHSLLRQAFVERLQILRDEEAIFTNQLSVEPDFAAAIVGPLNQNEVPVNSTAIAVVGFFVSIARREVKRATDLFIE